MTALASSCFQRSRLCLALTLCSSIAVAAVQKTAAPADHSQSVLKQHYDAAQHFQQTGDMTQAARQYRIFIADALFELALVHARQGDYQKAAPLFDEALRLAPNSPALRIEYAQAALAAGDLDHAKSLSEGVLRDYANDNKAAAKAHLILGRTLLKQNKDQQARQELESAVALNPDFENGYALATACLDLEDQKCAAKVFSEMQASFGDTAAIHMEFGRAYGQSDFQSNSIAEFKQAIAEDPKMPGAHYSLAAAYLSGTEASGVDDAIAELKKELEISPRDSLTYAALGHIAEKQHKYAEAEGYLKQAIALDPKTPDAYLYLGQVYAGENKTAEAEAALRNAILHTTDPSRNRYQVQKAHFLLGRLLMQSGEQQEAQKEMATARALTKQDLSQDHDRLSAYLAKPDDAPQDAFARQTGNTATEAPKDTENSRKIDAFAAQLTPAIADSYNNLGAIAAGSKDYSGAVIDFERAAEWKPSLPGLDYNWGRAAFSASDFPEAVGPLSRYLTAHPADTGARSALGVGQFMTGDYSGAVKTLAPLSPQTSSIPQVAYVYAASLVKTGEVGRGMALLTVLEKKDAGVSDIHRALGEGYVIEKNASGARSEFEAALKLDPSDAAAYSELGQLQLKDGDTTAAITSLEAAARLKPASGETHLELAEAYKKALRPDDSAREMKQYEALHTASGSSRPN